MYKHMCVWTTLKMCAVLLLHCSVRIYLCPWPWLNSMLRAATSRLVGMLQHAVRGPGLSALERQAALAPRFAPTFYKPATLKNHPTPLTCFDLRCKVRAGAQNKCETFNKK